MKDLIFNHMRFRGRISEESSTRGPADWNGGLYIHTYIHTYICMYVYTCVYYIYTHIYLCIYLFLYSCSYWCVYMYVYTHIHKYIYKYTYMHIYIYTYIHVYILYILYIYIYNQQKPGLSSPKERSSTLVLILELQRNKRPQYTTSYEKHGGGTLFWGSL